MREHVFISSYVCVYAVSSRTRIALPAFACVDVERLWFEALGLTSSKIGRLRQLPQLAVVSVCRTPSASATAKSSRYHGEYAHIIDS